MYTDLGYRQDLQPYSHITEVENKHLLRNCSLRTDECTRQKASGLVVRRLAPVCAHGCFYQAIPLGMVHTFLCHLILSSLSFHTHLSRAQILGGVLEPVVLILAKFLSFFDLVGKREFIGVPTVAQWVKDLT